jgi:hypothetical protein
MFSQTRQTSSTSYHVLDRKSSDDKQENIHEIQKISKTQNSKLNPSARPWLEGSFDDPEDFDLTTESVLDLSDLKRPNSKPYAKLGSLAEVEGSLDDPEDFDLTTESVLDLSDLKRPNSKPYTKLESLAEVEGSLDDPEDFDLITESVLDLSIAKDPEGFVLIDINDWDLA